MSMSLCMDSMSVCMGPLHQAINIIFHVNNFRDLSENPWDCKCNSPTAALVTWLNNFKGPHARREGIRWIALINAYNTTCAAPTEWAGMPLMKLQELC